MKRIVPVIVIGLTVLAGQAFAQDAARHVQRKNINSRQHNQDHRIKQGVKSGQLTREEFHELKQERNAIRKEEHAYRSDGKLNKEERKDLQQDLSQMSKDIYSEKHDAETRPVPQPQH